MAFVALTIAFVTVDAQPILTPMASFAGTNGQDSYGVLVQAADGTFYGTTARGGANTNYSPYYGTGYGEVFKMSPDGTLGIVASFNGTNGIAPRGGLLDVGNGVFYGTTIYGGTSNLGTIFRVTTNGDLTAVASFVGTNGSAPQCALIKGPDGDFYGTTRYGGVDFDNPPGSGNQGEGTIFKVAPDGTLTTLYSFTSTTDGAHPFAPLLLANDGNFYGVTGVINTGVVLISGIIFRMTPDGTVTTLAPLTGDTGSAIYGGLIQGTDGNLYGLASGTISSSHLIRVSTNGVITKVAAFPSAPIQGGLLEATDGNFYGALTGDGSSSVGSIFQVQPDGTSTNIVTFSGPNGSYPLPGLLQANDGSFYGTTTGGGAFSDPINAPSGYGTVFRLTVPSATAPLIRDLNKSETNVSFTWGTLVGQSYQVQSATNLDSTNWVNFGPSFTATNHTASATDSITSAPQRFYRIVLQP
jgi:uncharacterized repeat protein (TIGR03803 family)